MSVINRRLKKAEKKLNLHEETLTVNIVCYSGNLPSDHQVGNINIHYIPYDQKAEENTAYRQIPSFL